MSAHLGDRVADFVDGELGHEARDRALAHLAHCASCRAEVDAERAIKSRLANTCQPTPSAEFLTRLIDLAEPGPPLPPTRRALPGAARPRAGSVAPGPGRPRNAPPGRPGRPRRGHRRLRYAAMGVLSLAAVTLTTSFAIGGGAVEPGAPVNPALNHYGIEHANTANMVPLTDPALDAYPAIDTAPGAVAPGPAASPAASLGGGAPATSAPRVGPSGAGAVVPPATGLHAR